MSAILISGASADLETELRALLARHPISTAVHIEPHQPWSCEQAGYLLGDLPDKTRRFVADVVRADGAIGNCGFAGREMNSLSRAVSRGQRQHRLPKDLASPVQSRPRAGDGRSWSTSGYVMLAADLAAFREAMLLH
ncbi:hypothetical protein [Streptomyces sp. NPDC001903]|uniref:hypothetical protein n=1 Tax=Streptomyces sp. NPDC001903 TaxID=3364622 RepID=UPI0036C546C6